MKCFMAGLVILATVAWPHATNACGDKFLVPGRGTRFQVRPHRESAAVLVFARPGSPFGDAVAGRGVEQRLTKSGYRPVLVTSAEELERLLPQRTWDVVVADLSDAPAVSGRTAAAAIVPVAYGSTKAALEAARQQYRLVLKSPRTDAEFVEAIDRALTERERDRPGSPAGARR